MDDEHIDYNADKTNGQCKQFNFTTHQDKVKTNFDANNFSRTKFTIFILLL